METKQLKILIVDDNPSFVKALALIIKSVLGNNLGHLNIAGNGEEALEAIKIMNYDFVFMDVNMPKMDGIEATKRINRECSRFTKIVGVSFISDFQTLSSMLHSGASMYINKANLTYEEVQKIFSPNFITK